MVKISPCGYARKVRFWGLSPHFKIPYRFENRAFGSGAGLGTESPDKTTGALAWPRSEPCPSSSSTAGLPLQQAQRTPPAAHYRGRNRPLLRWYQGEELLLLLMELMQSFESTAVPPPTPSTSPHPSSPLPPMNPVASCWLDSCLILVTRRLERSWINSWAELLLEPLSDCCSRVCLKGLGQPSNASFSSAHTGNLTSLFHLLTSKFLSVSLVALRRGKMVLKLLISMLLSWLHTHSYEKGGGLSVGPVL